MGTTYKKTHQTSSASVPMGQYCQGHYLHSQQDARCFQEYLRDLKSSVLVLGTPPICPESIREIRNAKRAYYSPIANVYPRAGRYVHGSSKTLEDIFGRPVLAFWPDGGCRSR